MYLGKVVEFATLGRAVRAAAAPVHDGAALGDPDRRARPQADAHRPDRATCRARSNPPSGCRFRTRCPIAQADLRRGRAAARRPTATATSSPATSPARRSPSRPRHCLHVRTADARYDVRLLHDQRVPTRDGITLSADVYLPACRAARCRRSSSGRRTSRRASASSPGASGSRSAATRRSSSTCAAATSRTGSSCAWELDGVDAHDTLTWAAGAAVVQRAHRHVGAELRRRRAVAARASRPSEPPCIAPHVIHDDYFWDGYFTGGAFQLALTLGAAALWTSAMALITGPSAADLVLNDRVLRHLPLIELDEVTIGRKVDYWREWWEHQTNDELLAAVPAPAREGRRADLPAGRLVRPVLGLAPALVRGDRRPACRTAC